VPLLQGLHARGAALDHLAIGASRRSADRVPRVGDGHARTRSVRAQQVAALAAGKQDKAWQFIETFYREQGEEGSGYVTDRFLEGIASEVAGLDLSQWKRDRSDRQLADEIVADADVAETAGLTGTPSFLIGKSAGAMTQFAPTDAASIDAAIKALLET
jgi:protein-disulfide isomerase